MMTIKVAELAAVMVGAAVGLAAPASADLVDGNYQRTGDGPGGNFQGTLPVVITSCGNGCKSLAGTLTNGEVVQLHLQGQTWTGTNSLNDVLTIDNVSLTGTETGAFLKVPVHYTYVKAD